MSISLGIFGQYAVLEKNCEQCIYRDDELRDDGNGGKLHCYMFREEPKGNHCGQFKATEDRNPKCRHERLNEDGICRSCGEDCRGIHS